jgi:hypothetical protein
MPGSISDTKKACVQAKIELSLPSKVIAKEEHVSLHTVQRLTTNIQCYGSIQVPRALHQGWPRIITPEMEEVRPLNSFQIYSNVFQKC